jgi:hypothetical protein
MSHRPNESPDEKKKAEALAVEEAKKIASKNIPQTSHSAPSTPSAHSRPAISATPNTPKEGIPNGVFLGF